MKIQIHGTATTADDFVYLEADIQNYELGQPRDPIVKITMFPWKGKDAQSFSTSEVNFPAGIKQIKQFAAALSAALEGL